MITNGRTGCCWCLHLPRLTLPTNISQETQGLRDRHLLVLEVAGGREAKKQKLREQFQVKATEFTILLVGKDGTEKYCSRQSVALQDIFDVIDQMPMRQQEMRGQE